jgi:hypothetical protein
MCTSYADSSGTLLQQMVTEHPDIVNQITSLMHHGYVKWAGIQTVHAESYNRDRLKLQVSIITGI